jgi:hypothetical protein
VPLEPLSLRWERGLVERWIVNTLAVIAVVVAAVALVPLSQGQNQTGDHTLSFTLHTRLGTNQTVQLNVNIPSQLIEYYMAKDHSALSVDDFAKFITPYTLKPIADRLWQIYSNPEDFTNGVLMIVHQLTYQITGPEFYPIEVLASGKGDCALFSFIAASILEAGGIQTVLLYYHDQEHMNIGVALPEPPQNTRSDISYIPYQNITYYIAETTGGQWMNGWRVGECPGDFANDTAHVVTLDGMEQTSIGQVSASISQLQPSCLSTQIKAPLSLDNSAVTVWGQAAPQLGEENITLQASTNGSPWQTIGVAQTMANGSFQYSWTPKMAGVVSVQAIWSGNQQYNGAESPQTSTVILPTALINVATALSVACLGTLALFKKMQKKKADDT